MSRQFGQYLETAVNYDHRNDEQIAYPIDVGLNSYLTNCQLHLQIHKFWSSYSYLHQRDEKFDYVVEWIKSCQADFKKAMWGKFAFANCIINQATTSYRFTCFVLYWPCYFPYHYTIVTVTYPKSSLVFTWRNFVHIRTLVFDMAFTAYQVFHSIQLDCFSKNKLLKLSGIVVLS